MIKCTGEEIQVLSCKNKDCTDCSIENSRKIGCNSEFSLTYELSCGKLPRRREGDLLGHLHDNPNCSKKPEVTVGAPARCISGLENFYFFFLTHKLIY